ncbi:MAG: radical SAM protein [Deltaproteobacteria bacterium]|nr:radical SAM protein [Deltaproteobacteria bacterium]MBI3293779.1 radical SAM protein [Deltaproteobacteria bacterium]
MRRSTSSIIRNPRAAIKAGLRYAKALARPMRPALQPSLSIETTNVCNSNCVFCPNESMERPRKPLEQKTFEDAVAQYSRMGGGPLDLTTVIGEPLLDKDLLQRIAYAHQFPNVLQIGFLTTLQHLDRFPIDRLVLSGLSWMTVSTAL